MTLTNQRLAYHCARLAIGLSLCLHGLVRLPKLSTFAEGMAGKFAETFIAGGPALAAGFALPWAEALLGLGILIGGRYVRWSYVGSALLMCVLIFGTCLIENWSALVSQLVHVGVLYLLLMNPCTPGPRESGSGPERTLPEA